MRAARKTVDRQITVTDETPYNAVQAIVDEALTTPDPARAAASVRRALLVLAQIATGPNFDWRRHRACRQVLERLVTR